MTDRCVLPAYGTIETISNPIERVEPSMHFSFDGKRIIVYLDEPLDQNRLLDLCFCDAAEGRTEINAIIEGRLRHSGKKITFHVACRPGFDERSIHLGVIAYWVLDEGFSLKDVDAIGFSGLCVDSFCPMKGIQYELDGDRRSLVVTTSPDDVIDLGTAVVCEKEVSLSCEAFWTYEPFQQIKFASVLRCRVGQIDSTFFKAIYVAIASSLRFCLSRGNVDLGVTLYADGPDGIESIGDFTAVHGKMYVPDEYDAPEAKRVCAQEIGRYFGKIVEAFDSGVFGGSELSQNREDASIITPSKIIELTSSFEHEFLALYPSGVEHGDKTNQIHNQVREAVSKAEKDVSSDSRRLLRKACEIALNDSLESRIRHVAFSLPDNVSQVTYRGLEECEADKSLGYKIATARNDIAHGNELSYKLRDLRGEYRLLARFVFAMRLMRLDIPDDDVARIMRHVN